MCRVSLSWFLGWCFVGGCRCSVLVFFVSVVDGFPVFLVKFQVVLSYCLVGLCLVGLVVSTFSCLTPVRFLFV